MFSNLRRNFNIPTQVLAKPWETNKHAGVDWFRAFLSCHPELIIRKPEATSIGQMSAFNKHNVDLFYNNLHRSNTSFHQMTCGTLMRLASLLYKCQSMF